MSTLKVNNIKSLSDSAGTPVTIEDSIKSSGSSVTNDTSIGYGSSIAFGQENQTTGVAAVSLAGRYNTASNYAATIAGSGSSATAFHAVAMGSFTSANGLASFAHGRDTIGSGQYSHAEGVHTSASGTGSHAEGYATTASGQYSHAEGRGTIASARYQHVQGKYNVADTDENALMIIGNGTSNGARKNLAKFTTASFILDEDALPTTDPGVEGQLYTTGSNLFGGPSGLKVLMVST